MLPKPPLVIASALLLACLAGTAAALGLGAMQTQSALNQPFYAEIELTDVNPDELDAVRAQLASRDEFTKAGAERPHFLTRLRFTPAIGTDGRPYIQVSSREPVREPYIDFLMEVIWPQGRLVKEYTVLLDPPARGTSAPPRLVPPRASARRRPPPEPEPAPPPLRSAAREPQQAQRQAQQQALPPRTAPAPVPPQVRGTRFPLYYGPVQPGANLTGIAREMTPPGATVEQTAMAIFRNNQDAFMRSSINMLRVGVDLVVPTAEELFALDAAAARRQFEDALAGRSVNTSPITDIPNDARLRIAAGGEPQPTAPAAPVPPAAAPPPMAADPALRQDLLTVQATTESNRQETTELRSRISELEQQLADIQRLLELRNEQLAQLRQTAGANTPTSSAALPVPPPPGSPSVAGAGLPPEAGDRPPPEPIVEPGIGVVESDGSVREAPAPAATAAVESAVSAAESGADSAAASGDEPTSVTAAGAEEASTDPASTAPDMTPEVAAATSGQPVWAAALDTVGGVTSAAPPWALAAGAGGVLLGGLGLLAYRRRRQLTADALVQDDSTEAIVAADTELTEAQDQAPGFEVASTSAGELDIDTLPDLDSDAPLQSLHTAAGASGPAIDVQTGLPVSVVSNLPPSQQETQEADVIAEADIYILYGRYREAEALLREELGRSPDRPELKYKLGEALLGSGNRSALAALLEDMRTAGDDARDAAKWASLQSGLAGLGAGGDEPDTPPVPTEPRIKPLDDMPTRVGSKEALSDGGATSTDVLGDSEDTGLGFSVREVTPSSAGRLREQMADLELDLRELDDFDGNLESTRAPDDGSTPPVYTEDVSGVEPTEPPLSLDAAGSAPPSPPELGTEPTPAAGAGTAADGDRLDLDLSDLEQLTRPPADSEPADLTLPLPDDMPALGGEGRPAQEPADELSALPDPLEAAESQTAGQTQAQTQILRGAPSEPDAATAAGAPFEDSISSDVLSSQWRMDSGLWDEAATKMDLARAYIEMEDPDAARAILEEVLHEGSEQQRADAQALLSQMA